MHVCCTCGGYGNRSTYRYRHFRAVRYAGDRWDSIVPAGDERLTVRPPVRPISVDAPTTTASSTHINSTFRGATTTIYAGTYHGNSKFNQA